MKLPLFSSAALLFVSLQLRIPTPCNGDMPPNPKPYQMVQPDGTKTGDLYLRGTLEYNWEEDASGYTVIRDEDGYEVYGVRDPRSGLLVSSHCIVGHCEPQKVGIDVRERPLEKALQRLQAGMEYTETRQPKFRPFHSKLRRARDAFLENSDRAASLDSSLEGRTRNVGRNDRNRELQGQTVLKNMVLLLRFSDHIDRPLPTREDFEVLFNTIDGNPDDHPDICPTGSVRDCFLANSYGKLDIQSEVFGWIDMPNTERFYADSYYGVTGKLQDGIKWALARVQEQLNAEGRGFRDFDVSGDGWIDGLAVINSGYDASWGGPDCNNDDAVKEHRIWAHKWNMGTWSSNDYIKIDDYHMNSALWGNCGKSISRIGVLCHETGHFLELPDLYDGGGGGGLGSWALMSNAWGFDGEQYYPPMMCPWSKMKLGWVQPTYITEDGVYEISASHSSPSLYAIKTGFHDKEYLVIENRQHYHKFDAKIPQSGLMIWHIDEKANISIEGHPDQTGWPENGKHYAIAILGPDGNYDLEKGKGSGDSGDVFHAGGVDEIGPDGVVVDGVVKPHPNTDAYQYGNIARTGHRIYDISVSGEIMTFKYCMDCERISTIADEPSSTSLPTVSPTDAPTTHPTAAPSAIPTDAPTAHPTVLPSALPTDAPVSPLASPSIATLPAALSPGTYPSSDNLSVPPTNTTATQNTLAGNNEMPSELAELVSIPSSGSSACQASKLLVSVSLSIVVVPFWIF